MSQGALEVTKSWLEIAYVTMLHFTMYVQHETIQHATLKSAMIHILMLYSYVIASDHIT